MSFSGFTANDFYACNGTRVGAQHLQDRMRALCDALGSRVVDRYPDLTPVISPLYTASGFRPNRNRPRNHACLFFVDRKLKKSAFPRLPQLGLYVHREALSMGFYSGWWTRDAMQNAIADRKKFRGVVPRKGYRCLAGDIIVESPERSTPWAPAKLDGVDRSLFVGRIFPADSADAHDPHIADRLVEIVDDLYALYAVFAEARRHMADTRVDYAPEPADPDLVRDALVPEEADLLLDLYRFVSLKGFCIAPDMLFNLYLCLKTKPFVMLAGISGTGKSTVIRLIAEAVNGLHEGRARSYCSIPVRPDWHDGRDLLGFENLLTGVYHPGALLHAMVEAQTEPDRPYFVCLDEMNLARVEHYFSDFLSVMETARRTPDGAWTTDPIDLGCETLHAEGLGDLPARLPIPPNLFVIGTVNMDETTHPFSAKVLDRANTIAFDQVDLALPDGDADVHIDSSALRDLGPALCDRPYRRVEDVQRRTDVTAWIAPLMEMNALLEAEDLQVTYRRRDDMLIYMAYAIDLIEALPDDAPSFTVQDAFDYQILQKILPRLSGLGDEALEVLQGLLDFCESTYPRSARKLGRMIRRLERTGFAHFW